MDLTAATAIAQAYVRETEKNLGIDLILLEEQTVAFNGGWVFFYDSRKYVEDGAIRDALAGNAPLIVSKRDGTVHVTGTACPIENYLLEFERTHGM